MPAIEPPPAPISIMSITGALIGRPEPRLKRCTRAASIIEATSMRPSSTRQALAVVPPMSNEITLSCPASLPNSAVARPPPAGPDSSSRIGNLRAAAGETRPPAECISRSAPAKAARGKLALEVRQIAIHQRLHIGIGAGRDRARIFAQLRHDVGGERHEQVGKFALDQRAHRLLVRRVGVGMQEADRDRLDAVIHEPAQRGAHRVEVERRDTRPSRSIALADLQPVAARDQRLGKAEEQVVDVVALLGPHLEHVAEALRREQAEPRAAPLDQRIGDERRAVHDLADIGERDAGLGREGSAEPSSAATEGSCGVVRHL